MLQLPHFPGQPLLKSCRRQHDKGVKKIFIFKVYVSFPRHGWFCGHSWSLLYLWDRNVIRCTLLTSCPIYNVTPIMDFRLIYLIKLSKWWWHLGYLIMVTFLLSLWSLYDFCSGRNKLPYTLGLKIKQICWGQKSKVSLDGNGQHHWSPSIICFPGVSHSLCCLHPLDWGTFCTLRLAINYYMSLTVLHTITVL